MHGENMQTPCRKTPGRESNPGPSCCKATVLQCIKNTALNVQNRSGQAWTDYRHKVLLRFQSEARESTCSSSPPVAALFVFLLELDHFYINLYRPRQASQKP
ncbi:hypothetical protein ATANTOWER_003765 [Ataeniobius toweri]|uniref:Uncharacterized protein n=1 Tax=Ataeniobius toweri TaxID=208326 RepID=A0ABU7BQG4_9TELE|nr:hypothetical protein [Ataeniobius toweri]